MSSRTDGSQPADAVAIIGLACRLPQAADPEAFWDNLERGVESILPLTGEELQEAGVDDATAADPLYVRAASWVDDIELFDAPFFGVSPREAEILDPQQRVFLECAWEAFENAGYDPRAFAGRIGVYAGARISDYFLYHLSSNPELLAATGHLPTLFANDKDYLATFVSYRLDLRGPSMTVQTACSSALVGVHLACESLLNGECDMALAGGISLRLPQKAGYLYQEAGILSPDGHNRSFDARARGTVFGNGAGAVVLKRLDRALADRDTIQAVVLGSAVNNDGGRKLGFSAPSEDGQAAVVAEALEVAGVDPATVGYVEAHGSATALGDPIEMAALARAFAGRGAGGGRCAVGSVKSNLGHLEAAAGIAGLLKTALMLRHGTLVPSVGFERLNPEIARHLGPFEIATAARPWPSDGSPRRAGVNSFGLGGTNAHVVLEEAPAAVSAPSSRPAHLLLLAARSAGALHAAGERLRLHLERHQEIELADAAYTTQVGRAPFAHRQAVLAETTAAAARRLATGDPARVWTGVAAAAEPPVAFMFPGLGEHYPGMAAALYRGEEVFRRNFDRCAELLHPVLGADLGGLLYPPRRDGEEAAAAAGGLDLRRLLRRDGAEDDPAWHELRRTAIAQPALFAVEYALAQLWISWGIRPAALIGYSLGEYVAACLAGILPLADALAIVGLRARLIEELPAGRMLAVPLAETALAPLLGPDLSMAALNGPEDCVVAGPPAAVGELAGRLAAREVASLELPTTHAFHSSMLRGAVPALTAAAALAKTGAPAIPCVSNLTGSWFGEQEARDPAYWGRHMCETVRFGAGLDLLLADPESILLEVGPGQALATLARRSPRRGERQLVLTSLRHRDDRQPDAHATLAALGRLWVAGAAVDWGAYHGAERRRRVPLPTYPFERQRYWVAPRRGAAVTAATASAPVAAGGAATAAGAAPAADVGALPAVPAFHAPLWRQTLPPAAPAADPAPGPWLLLGGGPGLPETLARVLRREGREVVVAAAGPEFARPAPGHYVIAPERVEDYVELLAALDATCGPPAMVVDLWPLAPPPAADPLADVHVGLLGLVRLGQAIGASGREAPLRLGVLAEGLADVSGRDRLRPLLATLLGACRTLPQEYRQVRCRVIDLDREDLAAAGAAGERLAETVAAELAGPGRERLVGLRGGRRWVPVFSPLELPEPVPALPGGAVLITGGLGALGLLLAESLADLPGARLVLLGRSALPERGEWEGLVARAAAAGAHGARGAHAAGGADLELVRKLRRLLALEAQGAEVAVVAADVADEAQVRAALAQAHRRCGEIRGVIHAAGIAGGGLIQLQTPQRIAATLAPKVEGARVLDRLLGDTLDFFVLFSSTLATLGGAGQAAYAAANCFLEAFAQERSRRTRGRTVAIAWDRWLEEGMGAFAGDAATAQAEVPSGLLSHEGVAAFWRALAGTSTQVVVSRQDFQTAVEEERSPFSVLDLEQAMAGLAPPLAVYPRPALQTPYLAPRDALEERLAALFRELLGLEQVGVDDNFFELGGDSLRGIQLAARARKAGLELATYLLFQHPTIAKLAAHLGQRAPAAAAAESAAAAAVPAGSAFPLAGLSTTDLDDLLAAFPAEE